MGGGRRLGGNRGLSPPLSCKRGAFGLPPVLYSVQVSSVRRHFSQCWSRSRTRSVLQIISQSIRDIRVFVPGSRRRPRLRRAPRRTSQIHKTQCNAGERTKTYRECLPAIWTCTARKILPQCHNSLLAEQGRISKTSCDQQDLLSIHINRRRSIPHLFGGSSLSTSNAALSMKKTHFEHSVSGPRTLPQ